MNENGITQFKGLQGFDYCNQALEFEKQISTTFLVLGEYLYNIKENNLFEPQWTTFNEFCDEFKSLSQASISKLVNIYSKFIVEYEIPKEKIIALNVGWSNIAETLSVVHSKEDAERWLELASTLSRNDLRKTITEQKTSVDMSQCAHQDYYIMMICRTCFDKWKVGDSREQPPELEKGEVDVPEDTIRLANIVEDHE